jgi:hypothetical protein
LKTQLESIEKDISADASLRVNAALNILFTSSVNLDKSLVRLIQSISTAQIGIKFGIDTLANTFKEDRNGDKSLLLFSEFSLCHNTGKFIKLTEFYKKWLDEEKKCYEIFLDWLQKKYGHRDAEIFSDSLCDIFDLKYRPLNYPGVCST